MTAPATGSQPTQPTGGTQDGQGQPAPVATPPAGTPAPTQTPAPTPPAQGAPAQPAGQQQPVGQQPAQGDTKTFTQDDVNAMIKDRMDRFEKSFGEKLAGQLATLLGGKPPEGDGQAKPEDVLAQAKEIVAQAQTRANVATARSYAQAAQIKPERVDALLGMVDLGTALTNVDVNNPTAVDAAIKAAVEAKANEFPEWKITTLPGSSTANPNDPNGSSGKPTYTRAQIQAMSQAERVAKADELAAAAAEGRIK